MTQGSKLDKWEELDPEKDWGNREKICFLLDHWSDIWEPDIPSSLSDETVRGNSSSSRPPGHMPMDKETKTTLASHPSVRRLEGALVQLASCRPELARHLKAYRINAQWRTVDHWYPVITSSGKLDSKGYLGRKRQRVVPRWYYPPFVAEAEDLLVKFFHGEVFVPQELWKGLTEPIVSDVTPY